MTTTITNCQYCGKSHGVRCPDVKAIEYGPDGRVTRVEFMTPADYLPQQAIQSIPIGPVTVGMPRPIHLDQIWRDVNQNPNCKGEG